VAVIAVAGRRSLAKALIAVASWIVTPVLLISMLVEEKVDSTN
jgi:hypothetical protein